MKLLLFTLFKLVQTCPNWSKLVQIGTSLFFDQFLFFQFQDSVNTDDQYNVVHSNVYTASSQVYIAAGVGGPNLAGAGSNLSGYNVIAASVDTSSHAFQSTNGTLGTENYQQQTQILSAVDPRMTRRQSTTMGESSCNVQRPEINLNKRSLHSPKTAQTLIILHIGLV